VSTPITSSRVVKRLGRGKVFSIDCASHHVDSLHAVAKRLGDFDGIENDVIPFRLAVLAILVVSALTVAVTPTPSPAIGQIVPRVVSR